LEVICDSPRESLNKYSFKEKEELDVDLLHDCGGFGSGRIRLYGENILIVDARIFTLPFSISGTLEAGV